MSSRRSAKVAQAIREVVSSTILREVRDPRVDNVTVLNVEVAEDYRSAKVHVSVMGDEKAEHLCLQGLRSSRGFLQAKIADQIQLRYTPLLSFVVDRGVKKSLEATRILRELEAERLAASDDPADETGEMDIEETDTDETDAEEIDTMSTDAGGIADRAVVTDEPLAPPGPSADRPAPDEGTPPTH